MNTLEHSITKDLIRSRRKYSLVGDSTCLVYDIYEGIISQDIGRHKNNTSIYIICIYIHHTEPDRLHLTMTFTGGFQQM